MSLARRCAGLLLSALLLHLVLIQPNHPGAVTWGAFSLVPLELPAILAGLIALRPTALSRLLRAALVLSLVAVAVLKSADLAMFTAFGRRFNPVGDLPLVEAGLRLLQGQSGPAAAILAALAAERPWRRSRRRSGGRPGAGAVCGSPKATRSGGRRDRPCRHGALRRRIGQAMRLWRLPVAPPGAAFTARIGVESVTQLIDTIADMRRFERAARRDPWAGRDGLLDRIDRDVLVIFVESYGRASLDQPLYAERTARRSPTRRARSAGLGLADALGLPRSPDHAAGRAGSPTRPWPTGCGSTTRSRYAAALASARETLFDIARAPGSAPRR